MKRFFLFSIPLTLGLALLVLGGTLASRLDRILYREEILFAQAAADYKQGETEKYQGALKDLVVAADISERGRALALYDLGVAAFKRAAGGDVAAARDAAFYFRQALRNDPLLFPAKYNLELLRQERGEEEKKTGDGPSRPDPKGRQDTQESRSLIVKPPFLGTNP